MYDKKTVLVGYSGHGLVVAEAAILSQFKLEYYTEKREVSSNPFDLIYLGDEGSHSSTIWERQVDFILGVGDNTIREKIALLIEGKGKQIKTVVHPQSSISLKVTLGHGTFVARNVSINPFVSIGNFCILNTGCIIDHECTIGRSVHIAPGAVLAGNVFVGNRSFIGANSVIKQGVIIGSDVIIGAGSVVLKDVPDGLKIAGNPAKIL